MEQIMEIGVVDKIEEFEGIKFSRGKESTLQLPDDCNLIVQNGLYPALQEELGKLRELAWRDAGYNLPKSTWIVNSDYDNDTIHFLVFLKNNLVGAARLTFHDSIDSLQDAEYYTPFIEHIPAPIASVTKVVVDPLYQGRGIGSFLHALCIEHAERASAACIACDVREEKTAIVKRLGYKQIGLTGIQDGWPDWDWAVMLKILNK